MAAEYIEFGLAGLFPLLMAGLTVAWAPAPRPSLLRVSRSTPDSATHLR